MSKFPPLPESSNEFWDGEKHMANVGRGETVCSTHRRDNWLTHTGYVDNQGHVTCKYCNWGATLPGYLRVKEEKIVDLRGLNG